MSTAAQDHSWADPADYWADPAYLRVLDREAPTDDHTPTTDDTTPIDGYTDDEPTTPGPTLPVLPDDFWDARPHLKHIRLAAHSRGRAGDLVLYALLARLSAMLDPKLQFDTGLGPGSLNFFAAAVAGSGVGKTSGARVARELLHIPRSLDQPAEDGRPRFHDGLPLGTGEGVAEAYIGTVSHPTGEVDRKGHARTERRRVQVRHNVFFALDEGQMLTKTGERSGATIGPTIRSAWVGELLGQANASEERVRIIPAGTYSMGMLVGFQPDTAAPLLADSGPGTPQRFIWCSARDPNIPEHRVAHPGPLDVPLTDADGFTFTGIIRADPAIADELWQRTIALSRGELTVAAHDAHEPMMRSKLAALLMLMDGRDHISLDDWELSRVCWDTSCAVRDALLQHGVAAAKREREQRTRQLVEERVRIDAAASSVPRTIQRVAELLRRQVDEQGGLTTGAAWRCLSGRDRRRGRELLSAAMEYGAAEGWFLQGSSGLSPATVQPRNGAF